MSTPVANLPSVASAASHDEDRVALSKDALKHAFLDNLFYIQGKFPALATKTDYYMALAYAVRDRIMQRWISTAAAYTKQGSRTVSYLSAEFLMGPHLGNNLINLGIYETARTAVAELGLDLEELLAHEDEPGLGNGGLGRLAACFIDSLATLEVPALGYGIRYEFGIFQQEIVDGWQVEKTDKWLRYGNPWEIARPEWCREVKFGGHTEVWYDEFHRKRTRWVPGRIVNGIPYDTPILGYHVNTANTLRLWKAEAPESFDFGTFNRGDYYGAVNQKVASENLTKVLYPNDEQVRGKELRLEQQYFFVSCSLQDMLRICRVQKIPPERFHEKFAVQMNDTHPSIAVAELMRLLIDEMAMDWERAWSITRQTFGYTNHTLLPEALERWPVGMFGKLLPRLLEIIYEINARFLDEVRMAFFGDEERIKRLSLIDESGERYVRMAHLASVGSHAINGVAALHSELLKSDVLHGLRGAVAGEVLQQDQWRDAAALDGAGQSAARALHHAAHRRRVDPRSRPAAQARAAGRRSGLPRRVAPDQARQQGCARRDDRAAHRRAGRSGGHLRRAGQAHPRIQAPAPEHPARHRAVSPPEDRSQVHDGAARVRLRRQGGAGLPPGQAHHPADHRRGRDHQSRSGRARPHQGGLPAELQRDQRPAHLSGRGSVRADLHRRQGSLGHRQHEVPDERRAHHRHGGRRQHRDLRGSRRRELLPVRARGARGRGASAPWDTARWSSSKATKNCRP